MKLVYPGLAHQFEFKENRVYEWIVEPPSLFAAYAEELWTQAEGGEGAFVLSEQDKLLEFHKYAEVVLNPLTVDVNDKRILNKLYQGLKQMAWSETQYCETQQMLSSIQQYLSGLEQESTYILTYDEVDFVQILKAADVKLEVFADSLTERLCQYIQIVSTLLNKQLLIFVNLKSYLTEQQLSEVYQTAGYGKVHLLLLENQERKRWSEQEIRYIIDCDKCEIF